MLNERFNKSNNVCGYNTNLSRGINFGKTSKLKRDITPKI